MLRKEVTPHPKCNAAMCVTIHVSCLDLFAQLVHRVVFTGQANTDPRPGSRLLRFTWLIILDMVLIPKELISGKNYKFWVYNFPIFS